METNQSKLEFNGFSTTLIRYRDKVRFADKNLFGEDFQFDTKDVDKFDAYVMSKIYTKMKLTTQQTDLCRDVVNLTFLDNGTINITVNHNINKGCNEFLPIIYSENYVNLGYQYHTRLVFFTNNLQFEVVCDHHRPLSTLDLASYGYLHLDDKFFVPKTCPLHELMQEIINFNGNARHTLRIFPKPTTRFQNLKNCVCYGSDRHYEVEIFMIVYPNKIELIMEYQYVHYACEVKFADDYEIDNDKLVDVYKDILLTIKTCFERTFVGEETVFPNIKYFHSSQ